MQTLHQHHDPDPLGRSQEHPMLRGLMADQTTAYAEEVRVLRQRVALLEAELAATKASRAATATASTPKPPPLTSIASAAADEPEQVSVFIEQLTPAVAAVLPTAPITRTVEPTNEPAQLESAPRASIPDEVAFTQPMTDPGFAQAWTSVEEDPSFEERVAERAFFQASTVDEESRSWLLDE